jgi:segregation and condensation protein A
MQDTYNINLPQFEGPFDLLLFFIERDELDIYDIPIAKVTDDFLKTIREMETLNIDIASEFILVAATLMRIKAKMLLPRKEIDESGNEIDPRQELVDRLLEYKRYKGVLDEIRLLEEVRSMRERRGNITQELQQVVNQAMSENELESITLFRLLKAFEKVMSDFKYRESRPVHTVVQYPYSIESQRAFIVSKVTQLKKANFTQLFEECQSRIHAIFTFLAILELLQYQNITITIGDGLNNFWVEPLGEEMSKV